MKRNAMTTALVLVLAFAPAARALTMEEVIRLSKSGVSEAVIVEMMNTDGSRFALDATAVEVLHHEGVADGVIRRMVELSQPPQAATVTPSPRDFSPLDRESRRAASARPSGAVAAVPAQPVNGPRATLTLRNEDERVKAFVWDAARRELCFEPEAGKGTTALARGASATLEIDPGVIGVRWDGDWQHYRVSLLPAMRLEFVSAPGVANGAQAIRLVMLRDGAFYGARNLKVFYAHPAANPPGYCPPCAECPQGSYGAARGVPAAPATVILVPEETPPASSVSFSFGMGFCR